MKSIGIDELKEIQLDILLDIHEFCKANNIKYSLAYGTLLGAIRHKGYIPWDEDIDIMMYRPDYERFVNCFSGFCDYLSICAPELDLNYYAPYANVWDNRTVLFEGAERADYRGEPIGVKIDIFPIDNTSNGIWSIRIAKWLFMLWSRFRYKNEWLQNNIKLSRRQLCANLIAQVLGYKNVQRLIMWNSKRLSKKDTGKVDMLAFFDKGDRKFDAKDFDSYIDVEFEGHLLPSIVGYDDYLRSTFGNYMQLPPEEERIPHHGFTAYWKDDFNPERK